MLIDIKQTSYYAARDQSDHNSAMLYLRDLSNEADGQYRQRKSQAMIWKKGNYTLKDKNYKFN